MMLIWLWGLTSLLIVVVMVVVWMQVKNQRQDLSDLSENHQLKQQVVHLEDHLKKTLEIMQDLAKKMHIQQEVLDRTSGKLQQLEKQQLEMLHVLAKLVQPTDK
ncbi:hypothetical protein [Acinetobacter sp. ANC 4641]|uniref:hypothetical protein n=1 Tax=Acinetobacter sp. ANC 4641 TaxID=2529847 RepID=UPI00103F0D73|nr:hypothetical protein [Acinetobacter sp. ANC 4641]TCB12606.1 hypothetical protein E0H78_05315 [Acinetobacter sp. ANC 4641]